MQTQTRIWLEQVLQTRLNEKMDIPELLADGELLYVSLSQFYSIMWTYQAVESIYFLLFNLMLIINSICQYSPCHIFYNKTFSKVHRKTMQIEYHVLWYDQRLILLFAVITSLKHELFFFYYYRIICFLLSLQYIWAANGFLFNKGFSDDKIITGWIYTPMLFPGWAVVVTGPIGSWLDTCYVGKLCTSWHTYGWKSSFLPTMAQRQPVRKSWKTWNVPQKL